jgi:hypothetical protein
MKLPSEEGYSLIKQYALLPYVLKVLERDKKVIYHSGLKTLHPYIALMSQATTQLEYDLVHVKREMRTHGIRVFKEEHTDRKAIIHFKYQNYEHVSEYLLGSMKDYIESKMRFYLGVTTSS